MIRYKYRTLREITRDESIYFRPDNDELLNAIRENSTSDKGEEFGDADDVVLLRVKLEHIVAEKEKRELHRQKKLGGYIK